MNKLFMTAAVLFAAVGYAFVDKSDTPKDVMPEEYNSNPVFGCVSEMKTLYCVGYFTEIPKIKVKDKLVGKESLVIIYRTEVKAGFDLKLISEEDIYTNGDSIILNLPSAKILSTICNPMDTKVFHGSTEYSEKDLKNLYKEAISDAKEIALEDGIIEKAEEHATDFFTRLLVGLGYKHIKINIEQ